MSKYTKDDRDRAMRVEVNYNGENGNSIEYELRKAGVDSEASSWGCTWGYIYESELKALRAVEGVYSVREVDCSIILNADADEAFGY